MAATSACGSSAASAGSRAVPKASRQVKAARRAASRRVAPPASGPLGDWGARIRPGSEIFRTVTGSRFSDTTGLRLHKLPPLVGARYAVQVQNPTPLDQPVDPSQLPQRLPGTGRSREYLCRANLRPSRTKRKGASPTSETAATTPGGTPWTGAPHASPASIMMVSRCIPCFSINLYSVVLSTPANRAAFDMFPDALFSTTVRYRRSKSANTRPRAVW